MSHSPDVAKAIVVKSNEY